MHTNTKTMIVALVSSASTALAGPYVLVDNTTDSLYNGTLGVNGGDNLVTPLGSAFWGDLANYNGTSVLAADVTNALVYRLNATTGAVEATSAVLDQSALSIAYDASSDTYYGVADGGSSDLFSFNFNTGVTTAIGAIGTTSIVSLAWDPVLGSLVVTNDGGELFTVNETNANTTLVGSMGVNNPFGIEYNPTDGGLYVHSADRDAIFRVNRATAGLTLMNTVDDATFATGLAFVPAPGAAAVLGLGGLALARRRR